MESLEDILLVSLAALRRHINFQKSSIYRLHPEILPSIARHFESKSDLIRATHISCYWRSTLLSHPGLWARLDFRDTGRAIAFLERSKSASLHIDLTGDGEIPPSFEFLCPHATRIVTLGLLDRPDQRELLSQRMPSLRGLEITNDIYEDEDDLPHTPVDEETSWSFPSVTSLAVRNTYPIPFHVPHLTRFKFRFTNLVNKASILEDLLDFLRSCPLLEDLEISCPEDFLSTDDHAVSLPNLCTYTQIMPSARGLYPLGLLNPFSLPLSCAVTLKSWTAITTKNGVANILPRFQNPTCLAGARRISLSVTPTAFKGFGFQPSFLGKLEFVSNQGGIVCLEREIHVGVNYQRTPLRDLVGNDLKLGLLNHLKDLDTHSVEILCIEMVDLWDDEAPTVDAVKEAMGLLGNIKSLVVSRSAVQPCLLALEWDTGADKDGHGFPQIQTLVVHSRSFLDPSGIDILRTLLPVARRRKVAGHPFKYVSVFLPDAPNLGDSEGEVEELRGCIENFRLVTGDNALDWDIEEYFLDGLGHLRNRRDVQWEFDDIKYYGWR